MLAPTLEGAGLVLGLVPPVLGRRGVDGLLAEAGGGGAGGRGVGALQHAAAVTAVGDRQVGLAILHYLQI